MLTQISCPRCQTRFNAEIYQVVDVGRNPQLKFELLNGTLNLFSCPNCGASGQLATPLLYHDPEHELFMVHVPLEMNMPHQEQQQLIGRLVQEAMNQIPPEQRRGYMLQPQEIISYQTFMEKVLETEGITADVIGRQREQAKLLQSMITADKAALDTMLEEQAEMIDETFFALLHNIIETAQQQDEKDLIKLINLQARLYTQTDVGRELERRQTILRQFQQDVRKNEGLTPKILAEHVIRHHEDQGAVEALVTMGQQALNYDFFNLLTQEIENQARQKNKAAAKALTATRERLLELHNEMQNQSREILEGAMATLQEILEAEDPGEAIRENMGRIDETFMYVLSAVIAQNEQQGRSEQNESLLRVQELIMNEVEQQAPPQIRLINRLLRAERVEDARHILDENPALVTREFVDMLDALAQEMAGSPGGDGQGVEMAARVNQIKTMVEARL